VRRSAWRARALKVLAFEALLGVTDQARTVRMIEGEGNRAPPARDPSVEEIGRN